MKNCYQFNNEFYFGMQLAEFKKLFPDLSIHVSLTKPPRDEEKILDKSRIVRIRIKDDECYLVVCNTLD